MWTRWQPVFAAVALLITARSARGDNPNGVAPYFRHHAASLYDGLALIGPAVDAKDRVSFAGRCNEELSGNKLTCESDDVMVVRHSATGAVDWAVKLTPMKPDRSSPLVLKKIRADKLGRVVVEGNLKGGVEVAGKKVLDAVDNSGFQLVLNETGSVVEAVLTPAFPYDEKPVRVIAHSDTGEMFIASRDYGPIVEKLASATSEGWKFNGGQNNTCTLVAPLAGGRVVFGGWAPMLVKGTMKGSARSGGTMLITYDNDGTFLSARYAGTVAGIAALKDGSLAVVGYFDTELDLAGNVVTLESQKRGWFVTVIPAE